MYGKLFILFSAGFVYLNVSGQKNVTLSHWAPWIDLSNEDPYLGENYRYKYALKKTLDAIWVMKLHLIDAKDGHEAVQVKDGQEIENATKLLDDMHDYLDYIGEAIARKLARHDVVPWERSDPLGKVVRKKLIDGWTEMKEVFEKYKPKEATSDHEKMCKAAQSVLREFPERYKPIYELVLRIQRDSWMNNATRKELAEQKIVIFDDSYP